ncbi:MAG: hypothetical protein WCY67_07725 [Acidithiobacillus sp.]
MTEFVGYEFLRGHYQLPVFPIAQPARIAAVMRIIAQEDVLLVPSGVAPHSHSPLDHVLFALKHEGTNLQVLAEVMPHVTTEDIGRAVWSKPNSSYVRIAAYLWEHFTGIQLTDVPSITASTVPVFNANRYVVSAFPQKNARWRVAFNGLGDLDYCVTVRRTEAIQKLLDENILEQTRRFFEQTEKPVMDRAITWAFLSETEGSFAIERETPPENKAEAFVRWVLAQSGKMETAVTGKMLLPVSVAMKRHEQEYLDALQSFSKPSRSLWDVRWIDQEQFDFKLNGGAFYRYWDATDVVRFSLQMAKAALREDLQAEVNALIRYDAIYRKVDAAYDVRNSDLSLLIRSCMQNAGIVSKNRRKKFAATVPEPVFDAIEQAWSEGAVSLPRDAY